MIEQVDLKRMRRVFLTRLTEELAAEGFAIEPKVGCSLMEDFITNDIIVRAIVDAMGEELDEIEAEYPANWWEAFKERWFPAWVPIKYTKVRLTARAVYPQLSLPDDVHRIYLDKHTSTSE